MRAGDDRRQAFLRERRAQRRHHRPFDGDVAQQQHMRAAAAGVCSMARIAATPCSASNRGVPSELCGSTLTSPGNGRR